MPLNDYQARIRREKRDALLNAAQDAFVERGFAGASVNAVAKAACVSTATLYKHFSTKQDLFGAVVGRMWEELGGELDHAHLEGVPVEEALVRIGREHADLLARDNVRALFRVIIAETVRFPDLGEKLYEHGKAAYLERLDRFLTERVEAGDLRVGDTGLATRQFLAMINDVVLWPVLLVEDLAMTAEARERVVREAVTTFLARHR